MTIAEQFGFEEEPPSPREREVERLGAQLDEARTALEAMQRENKALKYTVHDWHNEKQERDRLRELLRRVLPVLHRFRESAIYQDICAALAPPSETKEPGKGSTNG